MTYILSRLFLHPSAKNPLIGLSCHHQACVDVSEMGKTYTHIETHKQREWHPKEERGLGGVCKPIFRHLIWRRFFENQIMHGSLQYLAFPPLTFKYIRVENSQPMSLSMNVARLLEPLLKRLLVLQKRGNTIDHPLLYVCIISMFWLTSF